MAEKNKKTEKIIISMAILLLLLFSYFLYDDSLFYKFQSKILRREVGVLNTKSSDVRRKYLDEFEWSPVKDFSKLFWGDSIFTGDRANAIIQLHEGSQISMDPQTLVVLNMVKDGFELDMEFGKMEVKLASDNILMKLDSENVSIKNTKKSGAQSKILISRAKEKNTEVIVLDGEVKIQKVDFPKFGSNPILKSKSIEVKASQKVELNSKINTFVPKNVNEFSILNPTSGTVWIQSPDQKIKLNWVYSGDKEYFDIDVATDLTFKKIIVSEKNSKNNSIELSPLINQEIYWRIKAFSKDNKLLLESKVLNFRVVENYAPIIKSPLNEQIIIIPRDKTGKLMPSPIIPIKFEEKSKSNKILLQVSKEIAFNQIYKELEFTDPTQVEINNLPVGNYFIRLKTEGLDHPLTEFSNIISFFVEEDLLEKIGTPIIKDIDSPFTVKTEKGKLIWPTIKWNNAENANTYEYEVSENLNFKSIVKSSIIKETYFVADKLSSDKYFVRVRGISKTKFKGFWSESKIFEIHIKAPVLEPIKDVFGETKQWDGPAPLTPVIFKWSSVPLAKLYLVEIGADEKFSQVLHREQTVNIQYQWRVSKDGFYFVRITGYESSKKALTKTSNVEKFKYTFKRPLMKPVLLEPKEKFSFILYEIDIPNIVLKWTTDPKAYTSYVELSYDRNFKKIKHANTTTINNLVLDKNLIRGKVYWRVRTESKDREAQSSWSETGSFSVVGLEDMEQ